MKTQLNIKDACKILGINGDITPEIVKQAYRRASMQYHPDRNPAGVEMMKSVNLAYEALKDVTQIIEIDESVRNYGEDLNNAINAVINLNLTLEICGAWLWVSGDTRQYKEHLKEHGFRWAPKKKMWYFRPEDYKSFARGNHSMDEIRAKYGSGNIRPSFNNRLPV
jgi:curved DNA-binding protein CbpA